MPLLSSSLCPLLTEDVVRTLKVSGIETVIDYVMKDPMDIARSTNGLSLLEVLSIRQVLVSLFASFPITAADKWEEFKTNSAFICTGVPCIDEVLVGGVFTGELTELSGPSSIGKTQVCLSLSAHTIVHTKSTVIYIDTNGSFSISRLKQLLAQNYSIDVDEHFDILEKLLVINICDFFQLLEFVQDIAMKMKTTEFYNNLHLIIIDSLDSLISPLMGEHFTPLLMQLVGKIRKLAQDYFIAVLYTSGVLSLHHGLKPILVKTWVSVPHTKLVITRAGNGDKRILTVEKSQRIKSGSVATINNSLL